MSTIPKGILACWKRLLADLEANSDGMDKADLHVDWSDILVMDAYFSDEWHPEGSRSYMGPFPSMVEDQ